MRNTKQKNLILSIVENSSTHPTAEEIYNICRENISNISLGTVYRNLNLLVTQGLIRRIKMENHIDHFDHSNYSHAHFICIECGEIIDLDKKYIVEKNQIDENIVLDCEVNYKGICKECKERDERYGIKGIKN